MTPTLYFLRSSETNIVKDMVKCAHPNHENPTIYSEYYGLTSKDLGLYALVDNKIAGAIWSRKLQDDDIPTLSIGILPEFEESDILSAMMDQFLVEASAVYEELKIETYSKQTMIVILEKFEFLKQDASSIMIKVLQKKEIVRPSDNYDPRRWMD